MFLSGFKSFLKSQQDNTFSFCFRNLFCYIRYLHIFTLKTPDIYEYLNHSQQWTFRKTTALQSLNTMMWVR